MIALLAKSILTLPFSNAEIERTFSLFKLNKSLIRNSLSNETIEAILIWKVNSNLINLNDPKQIDVLIKKYQEFLANKSSQQQEKRITKRKLDEISIINEVNTNEVIKDEEKKNKLSHQIICEEDQKILTNIKFD